MKKLLFLLTFVILNASECKNYEECLNLAKNYQVEQKSEKNALKLFSKICSKYKDYEACKSASDMYKYSNYKNHTKSLKYQNLSIKYLKNSCDKNIAKACYDYANFCEIDYLKCDNFDKYYEKSFDLYKKECENNNYSSCYFLAKMYFDGVGTNLSEENSIKLFNFACENKDFKSCYELSKIYEYKAKKYLNKTCELGYDNACKELNN